MKTRTREFKYKIGQRIIDYNENGSIKRDITIMEQQNIKGKGKCYKYICNRCGFDCGEHYSAMHKKFMKELFITEGHLLEGKGCSCCKNYSIVKGINDIATTHPHLAKYFKIIEDAYIHSYGSSNKIPLICPDCGYEKYTTINQKFSCKRCGDGISYPEKVMFNVLEQLRNDFITQYTKSDSKWCNKYKYDFYFKLNDEQYIIETHGEQHYKDNSRSKVKDVQANDKIKKELALKNGIKEENYIVIDCRESQLEFIKQNILDSKLNELFNLYKIDWIKCGKYATSNIVKEVCDYWKLHVNINNENLSTTDLGIVFKRHRKTIRAYLKTGNEIKWCNYSSEDDMLKRKKFTANTEIEMFNLEGDSLGVFPSLEYIENHSEKLFGIKLEVKSIARVARGERNHYKGYTFIYIKEYTKQERTNYIEKIKNSNFNVHRRIEIFKDGKSLGIFNGSTELSIQSEKLFGVHLSDSKISAVCTGHRNHHKGFTFKYVVEN